ncbi:MAG: hypothetical protein HY337_02355 [Gemmatimonadetes bacterium]|nr:hypothetical protein [Gemmatimonadota bacterium]
MSRVFFTDRDLGKKFPQILREAGLTVERHADHFAHDCPDEEWLQVVGERAWVAITHDSRIRYKPNELEAVVRHRVALLVVVGRASYPALAAAFVSALPRIESFLESHDAPFIAKVYRPTPADMRRNAPGRVELWYP